MKTYNKYLKEILEKSGNDNNYEIILENKKIFNKIVNQITILKTINKKECQINQRKQ